ncbi:MAG: hypothetical protein KF687_14945 [Cyclobacteriaceae bacterium]|nr:hypothetical protein [Cyclobacteriaceae bacterium]
MANLLSDKRFAIEDGACEVTFIYRKFNELIVLSAQLNNSVSVNLILDTGFRNTILFGKKFQTKVNSLTSKTISFSGLGNGSPLIGKISLDNELKFNGVKGSGVTIVLVPSRAFVDEMPGIDGVIGYDLLRWFEIEVNPVMSTVTFRHPEGNSIPDGFTKLDLKKEEVLPIVSGQIEATPHTNNVLPLLIDTGSQLGVLLKSQQIDSSGYEIMARGLCGYIKGMEASGEAFWISQVHMASGFSFSIIPTEREEMLSIGMHFLKDYVFIINSVEQYVAFKTLTNKQQKENPQVPLMEIAQKMTPYVDSDSLH